jgi:hypothetical protein
MPEQSLGSCTVASEGIDPRIEAACALLELAKLCLAVDPYHPLTAWAQNSSGEVDARSLRDRH